VYQRTDARRAFMPQYYSIYCSTVQLE